MDIAALVLTIAMNQPARAPETPKPAPYGVTQAYLRKDQELGYQDEMLESEKKTVRGDASHPTYDRRKGPYDRRRN